MRAHCVKCPPLGLCCPLSTPQVPSAHLILQKTVQRQSRIPAILIVARQKTLDTTSGSSARGWLQAGEPSRRGRPRPGPTESDIGQGRLEGRESHHRSGRKACRSVSHSESTRNRRQFLRSDGVKHLPAAVKPAGSAFLLQPPPEPSERSGIGVRRAEVPQQSVPLDGPHDPLAVAGDARSDRSGALLSKNSANVPAIRRQIGSVRTEAGFFP